MAVVVKELIVKAVIDNRIAQNQAIPLQVRDELVQEAVEQVLAILHVDEDGIR